MKLFDNFGFSDYLLLIGITLTIHVTRFYYKYFTRINPLPGPFPFPFVGNLPQLFWSGGIPEVFFEYNRKKYGDIFEVYLGGRNIVLNRSEYFDRLLTPSTKSPYLMRSPHSKGLDELELTGKGLLFNNNLKSWKYNRQFFSQAILSPKFTQEAIDCTNKLFNDLENYWNKLYLQKGIKEKNKLDFSKWLNHYTNDVIITLLTGKRSCSMAAYFNTLSDEPSTMILNDSVELVDALRKHLFSVFSFLATSSFLRHYVPFFKNKSDDFIRNIRFINQRLDGIIKRRRKEIENTPLDEPLPHDMLTSVITANTSRDVNNTKSSKNVDSNAMKPMTDDEIRGIIFDGFLGGTDTVSKSLNNKFRKYINIYLFIFVRPQIRFHSLFTILHIIQM
jgi:cytochrome P450